jgi:hypothetical protein
LTTSAETGCFAVAGQCQTTRQSENKGQDHSQNLDEQYCHTLLIALASSDYYMFGKKKTKKNKLRGL